jgi:hypothetical protein
MTDYFILAISVSVISWIVGVILNFIFTRTKYYKKISELNFIRDRDIGIKYFKWIVTNTFFKFLNQGIKIKNKRTDLKEVRKEMTLAEMNHLFGFMFATVVSIYMSITKDVFYGLTIMVANVFMNLYPSLLQQENKRRIDNVILWQKKR